MNAFEIAPKPWLFDQKEINIYPLREKGISLTFDKWNRSKLVVTATDKKNFHPASYPQKFFHSKIPLQNSVSVMRHRDRTSNADLLFFYQLCPGKPRGSPYNPLVFVHNSQFMPVADLNFSLAPPNASDTPCWQGDRVNVLKQT